MPHQKNGPNGVQQIDVREDAQAQTRLSRRISDVYRGEPDRLCLQQHAAGDELNAKHLRC